ncbi:MAG: hypothetical protein KAR39_11730 [Thermoplasmata archaeon]|nr:hypothetical protein [Thermoplasmata archaeon]
MLPTDHNRKELEVNEDSAYLFWTIVQAVRDYVFFKKYGSAHKSYKYYRFAKRWITNPQVIAQWGDAEDALCFTFGEALEMLGVQPENVVIFRDMIRDARKADTQEETTRIVRNAYSELHFHDNEPDPLGWIAYHPQGMSLRTEEVN